MKRLPVIFVFLLAVLAGVSCSVTRKLPEESYLVQKVTVEADKETPKKERIPASDLRKFIRQNPNKRFLGLNFYVWVYEQADPEKDNWWNRFKRRIGEAPVLLDMSLTEQSVRNLKVTWTIGGSSLRRRTYEVDTTSRKSGLSSPTAPYSASLTASTAFRTISAIGSSSRSSCPIRTFAAPYGRGVRHGGP